jgi:hypothetical protein
MTLEDQILALCAEAEPLRCLPDEEAEGRGLPQLVERINLLRSMQMTQGAMLDQAITERDEAEFRAIAAELSPPKRRGRPPKAAA